MGLENSLSQKYALHAYHLTNTLKLKEVNKLFTGLATAESSTKLIFKKDSDKYFFVYRFGSIVFFNMERTDRESILEKLQAMIGQTPEMVTSDEFTIDIQPDGKTNVGFENATLKKLSLEAIDILTLVMAQSTALEFFELKMDDLLKKTDDFGLTLRQKGRLVKRASEIKKFIGYCITVKQDLVSTLYILDKPDETWNNQELDNLYHDAKEMFELTDRYKTLDYKLRMAQENLELISELLQYRNANSLEWAIIILIAVEIILFLFQLFVL